MTKCISHIVQLCRADVFIEKRVLYKMPSPMQMFVILTQALSIAAQWIYRSYSAFSGSFDNRVAVAAFIGDKTIRVYTSNKSASLCTISDRYQMLQVL